MVIVSAHVNDPVAYGTSEDDKVELIQKGRDNFVIEGAEPEFYVTEVTDSENMVVVYAHRIAAEGKDKNEAFEKIEDAIVKNKAQEDSVLETNPNLYFLVGEEATKEPLPELEDRHFVDR